jgi:hypothetical protein
MTKRDLALDLFKTFKTGVTRKPNKPAPTKTVGQVGDPELIYLLHGQLLWAQKLHNTQHQFLFWIQR